MRVLNDAAKNYSVSSDELKFSPRSRGRLANLVPLKERLCTISFPNSCLGKAFRETLFRLTR